MRHLHKHLFLLLLFISSLASCQQNHIGLGWAKNSVNGTIFRKNSVTSLKGTQITAFYDSAGFVVIAKRKLGSNNWDVKKTKYKGNVKDAHNSISIAIDGNGYIHMAWDHHGHPLRYCISDEPFSLSMGDKQNMLNNLEEVVTYPEFFRAPTGDLIFIYRDGWSGNANCVINRYDVKNKKWNRLHNNLISGEGLRSAYWQSCVDKNGVIHISWVWRESPDVASNHDMCYAKSLDGGKTWQKSTGEDYNIPITAASAEYVCRIPQGNELMNQTSIYADSKSKPFIASYWKDSLTQKPQYQLIFLDDSLNWKRKTLSNRKSTFSLSGGGTKKIPISRPQIMVDDSKKNSIVYLIYRDNEKNSKVSMNVCKNINADTLKISEYELTNFSVGDWEPSYDIDLWKESFKLNLYVQKMEQGDGESLSNLEAQPVSILDVKNNLSPIDSFLIPSK